MIARAAARRHAVARTARRFGSGMGWIRANSGLRAAPVHRRRNATAPAAPEKTTATGWPPHAARFRRARAHGHSTAGARVSAVDICTHVPIYIDCGRLMVDRPRAPAVTVTHLEAARDWLYRLPFVNTPCARATGIRRTRGLLLSSEDPARRCPCGSA